MSWSTTPPVPIAKPGWTTDPTIHIPGGNQQWAVYITPRIRAALRAVRAAMGGDVRQQGDLAVQLRTARFSGAGGQTQSGDLTGLLQPATFLGTNLTLGQLPGRLQPARAALTGGQQIAGTMGGRLQPARAAATGTPIITGTITAQLPAALMALAGAQGIPGTLAAEIETLAAAAAGSQSISGTIALALRRVLFTASGTQVQTGTLAARLRNTLAAMTGTVESLVQFDNSVGGGYKPGSSTSGQSYSWAHVNTGNCIVVVHTNASSTTSTACTYGGISIPRVYGPTAGGTVFPYTSYCQIFALVSNSLPQGSNNVQITNTTDTSTYYSATFKNAGSISTSGDSASGNVNKASATGAGRAAVAGYVGGGSNFGAMSPNEGMRYGVVAFNTFASVAGYGLDTGSGITFSSSHSGAKAGAVVTILPN